MPFVRLLTLALISGAGLLLEIALTRVFSAVYYPPYVFAILALAVLGIGLGAATAVSRPALCAQHYQPLYLAAAATTTLLVPIALTASLSFDGLFFGLATLPFIFVGLTLVSIFSQGAANVLYMADLIGAGLGVILAVPLMNSIGPFNAVLAASALFAAAGLYPPKRFYAILPVVTTLLLLSNIVSPWLRIDYAALATAKPIQSSLRSGTILATRWDAFARTDLIRPDDGSPYRLYIDGAAASIMPPAADDRFLISNIGFFPFATTQPARALVIGPGAGLDVWFALNSGVQHITAVEVNPASVELVRALAADNGALYDQPSVQVVVDEGRSVLRRSQTQYDLIFLSQVVTLTSERIGYALTENTIYTVEAFEDYWLHLTDSGYIALTLYDELTLTRALSTTLAALRQQGITEVEALRHTAAFLDTQSGKPIPLLMIGRQPFSRDDSLVYGAVARQVGFTPLYLPHVLARPPLDRVEAGTLTFANIIADAETDISPPTDDRPFFYQFERGIPADLRPLLIALSGLVVAGGGILIFRQRTIPSADVRWSPIYFASLGAGFMLVEITIIQQSRLFIGHPTLALTTVLAVLLIGGGIGSWLAGWLKVQSPRWPLLGVLFTVALWMLLWPAVNVRLLALPDISRVVVTGLCLLFPALFMGMPFPLGLRWVGSAGNNQIALAWAVNGVATVCGSVGAVALAITGGFRMTLQAGLAAYAVAAFYAFLVLNRDR
jgi:hypothetical protein